MPETTQRRQVPVDPRIRRRRIEVRRDEGRRRLRMAVVAVGVAGMAVGSWALTRSPLLDVDKVAVVGAQHTPEAAVVTASGIRPGVAMTDVGEGEAAAGVETLPWVASASVRLRWPGTVVIEVQERRAAASVPAQGGGWVIVDASGRLLERAPSPLPARPAIDGVPPAGAPGERLDQAAAGALAVAAAIPDERVAQASVVAMLPDGTLELRLAAQRRPAGVVRFGRPDQLADKLLAMFTVLDRVNLSNLAVLDVRVPTAPVVTRQPVSAVRELDGAGERT